MRHAREAALSFVVSLRQGQRPVRQSHTATIAVVQMLLGTHMARRSLDDSVTLKEMTRIPDVASGQLWTYWIGIHRENLARKYRGRRKIQLFTLRLNWTE